MNPKMQLLKQWAHNPDTQHMVAMSMDAPHIAPYRQLARSKVVRLNVTPVKLDNEAVPHGYIVDASLTIKGQQWLANYRNRGGTVRVVEPPAQAEPQPALKVIEPVQQKTVCIQWSSRGVSLRKFPIVKETETHVTIDLGYDCTITIDDKTTSGKLYQPMTIKKSLINDGVFVYGSTSATETVSKAA